VVFVKQPLRLMQETIFARQSLAPRNWLQWCLGNFGTFFFHVMKPNHFDLFGEGFGLYPFSQSVISGASAHAKRWLFCF